MKKKNTERVSKPNPSFENIFSSDQAVHIMCFTKPKIYLIFRGTGERIKREETKTYDVC